MRNTIEEIFEKDSSVLPYFIKLKYGIRIKPKNEKLTFLQPTRFSSWKGSQLSLECMTELFEGGYDFSFIHGGCNNLLYGSLKIPSFAKKWVDSGNIRLESYSFEEINQQLKEADIILSPTVGSEQFGEPFSLVCLEAMLLEKPIIASDSGFIPLLLQNYSRTQIVKAGSKEKLLEAIRKWVEEPLPELRENDKVIIQAWKQKIETSPKVHIQFYEQFKG